MEKKKFKVKRFIFFLKNLFSIKINSINIPPEPGDFIAMRLLIVVLISHGVKTEKNKSHL